MYGCHNGVYNKTPTFSTDFIEKMENAKNKSEKAKKNVMLNMDGVCMGVRYNVTIFRWKPYTEIKMKRKVKKQSSVLIVHKQFTHNRCLSMN